MTNRNFRTLAWRRAGQAASAGAARSAGFTLIEMMMVIGLISIVGAIVIGKVYDNFNKGKYGAGKAAVHSMEMKVQAYILDNGSPPQSLNDLITRPGNAANWTGPYAKPGDLNDPFGHPFQYKAPGDHGDFDIIFLGKDGAPGGDGLNKDVGNWE